MDTHTRLGDVVQGMLQRSYLLLLLNDNLPTKSHCNLSIYTLNRHGTQTLLYKAS